MQAALRGHRRIQLPQAAGSRVPGVHESFFSRFFLLLIQGKKVFRMHDRLAPDLQNLGIDPRQFQRNCPDRARVGRDILTDNTVPPGSCRNENPLLIPEIDRETVKLQLRDIFNRRILGLQPEGIPDTLIKRAGPLRGKIGLRMDRQHRNAVRHLRHI